MKKLASVLLSSAVVASMCTVAAVSASAEVTELPENWDPTQYSYTVVGDANLLGDAAWQPENDDYNLSYDEAAGIWYINLTGVGNLGQNDFDYGAQYKVVVRDYDPENAWAFSFNETGVAYGYDSNSLVDFGDEAETAQVVTIMFDGEKTSSRIDNPYTPQGEESHTYFAVGSAALFAQPWDPAVYEMAANSSTGIYEVTVPVTEDQWDSDFEYKVARDGNWDVSYNDEGLATGEATNAIGYIEDGATAVVITWDPSTEKAGFYCVNGQEDPTEEDPTEVPTEDETTSTEAPSEDETEAPSEDTTQSGSEVATSNPTGATSATNPTATGTSATNPTTKANSNTTVGTTTSNTSSATGKVATGDSTSVAVLLGTLMLAGAAVVVARKKISE